MNKIAQQREQHTSEPVRVTVQGELNELFNLLYETATEIDELEKTLEPVLHSGSGPVNVFGEGAIEGDPAPTQPELLNRVRILISSARVQKLRLQNIRFQAAL